MGWPPAPRKFKPLTEAEQWAAYEKMRARRAQLYAKNKSRFMYVHHMARVRANPGVPARIDLFKEGTRIENRNKAGTRRSQVRSWLTRYYPMEMWRIQAIRVPDTWGQFQLVVTYEGVYKSDAARKRDIEERKARFRRKVS
jgi:hypothetical protein